MVACILLLLAIVFQVISAIDEPLLIVYEWGDIVHPKQIEIYSEYVKYVTGKVTTTPKFDDFFSNTGLMRPLFIEVWALELFFEVYELKATINNLKARIDNLERKVKELNCSYWSKRQFPPHSLWYDVELCVNTRVSGGL